MDVLFLNKQQTNKQANKIHMILVTVTWYMFCERDLLPVVCYNREEKQTGNVFSKRQIKLWSRQRKSYLTENAGENERKAHTHNIHQGMRCAAEPTAELLTEETSPTCQILLLGCLPLQTNHLLLTEPDGKSLTDEHKGTWYKAPFCLTQWRSPPQTSSKIWFLLYPGGNTAIMWALPLTQTQKLSLPQCFHSCPTLCFSETSLNLARCKSMFLSNNYQLKAHKGNSQTLEMTTSCWLTLLKRQEDW